MTAEDSAEYVLLFLNELNDDDDADECFWRLFLVLYQHRMCMYQLV